MKDADRIEALLDLVDPERRPAENRAPQLVVLGLAVPVPKQGYRPTAAGWAMLGERGRPFRLHTE